MHTTLPKQQLAVHKECKACSTVIKKKKKKNFLALLFVYCRSLKHRYDHVLGKVVPSLPAAVHAVPAVRGSLQSTPGAWARGWPAGDFVFVAE